MSGPLAGVRVLEVATHLGESSVRTIAPWSVRFRAGDTAPSFTARASLAGEEFDFSLADALEDGTVVVYFYPSAYTQGCNIQAREFAVNMDEFREAGASVIGVSLDSIERLNDFSADPEYCAGKLPVASDESGEIARSYGLEVADGRPGIKDTRGIEIDLAQLPFDDVKSYELLTRGDTVGGERIEDACRERLVGEFVERSHTDGLEHRRDGIGVGADVPVGEPLLGIGHLSPRVRLPSPAVVASSDASTERSTCLRVSGEELPLRRPSR
mgnify:CR=1 FL=1